MQFSVSEDEEQLCHKRTVCITKIELLFPDLEEEDYAEAAVASCCNGLLSWKALLLKDFAFDRGYTTTQDSHIRRMLLVMELLRVTKGAEHISLVELIAKNEEEQVEESDGFKGWGLHEAGAACNREEGEK